MNGCCAKCLKNINIDAKFLAHHTVPFIFSNYLKTCSPITEKVHEHAKKSPNWKSSCIQKKVHKFKKSSSILKKVHRIWKKFIDFEKSSSILKKSSSILKKKFTDFEKKSIKFEKSSLILKKKFTFQKVPKTGYCSACTISNVMAYFGLRKYIREQKVWWLYLLN